MVKNKGLLAVLTALFLAIEILLGVLLQICSGRTVALCSFGAVVLCCLFCILLFERSVDYALIQMALACTVCADYFLVWSQPRVQLPAMMFFLVVQLLYFACLYLTDDCTRRKRWQILSRGVLSIVILAVTVAVLNKKTDALALVSMLYYTHLLLNVVFAFADFRKHTLLSIGLLLFLCCDTVIGLDMLNGYLPIAEDHLIYKLIHPGFDLAWACYLPSQVLIVLSLLLKSKPTE